MGIRQNPFTQSFYKVNTVGSSNSAAINTTAINSAASLHSCSNATPTTGSLQVSYSSLSIVLYAGSMKWRIILCNLSSLIFLMILFYHKFHNILLLFYLLFK